jgi:putative membrane protein insertion efficiency factor
VFVATLLSLLRSLPARAARALIFVYRVTFSAFAGRFCRYAPTCSEYADEAIAKHGLWAGGWMGFARICRCRPGGGAGFDPVPETLRADASPLTPWRYGVWRQRLVCEAVEPEDKSSPKTGRTPAALN